MLPSTDDVNVCHYHYYYRTYSQYYNHYTERVLKLVKLPRYGCWLVWGPKVSEQAGISHQRELWIF